MIRTARSTVTICLALALCAVMLLTQAFGWGPGGHMIVARIAYLRLNPRAKAEVNRLIKIPIDPVAITGKSLDFVNASHWPDDLRPDESFAETLQLHFADFPFSDDGTELPDLPDKQNVITALQHFVSVLQSNADDQERAQALRFIIHFVGDIHQPLHCSTRVTQDHPQGDRGGNLFFLRVRGNNGRVKKVKLHSYWDGGIGDFPKAGPNFAPPPLGQVSAAATRIVREFPDSDDGWKAGGPFDYAGWAKESSTLAQSVAYHGIAPNSTPDDDYNEAALQTVRKRAAWAGYRLAALLNAIFPEQ